MRRRSRGGRIETPALRAPHVVGEEKERSRPEDAAARPMLATMFAAECAIEAGALAWLEERRNVHVPGTPRRGEDAGANGRCVAPVAMVAAGPKLRLDAATFAWGGGSKLLLGERHTWLEKRQGVTSWRTPRRGDDAGDVRCGRRDRSRCSRVAGEEEERSRPGGRRSEDEDAGADVRGAAPASVIAASARHGCDEQSTAHSHFVIDVFSDSEVVDARDPSREPSPAA